MFEFLIDFEREFKESSGFSGLDSVAFSTKYYKLKIEVFLFIKGKCKGIQHVCGRYNKNRILKTTFVKKSRLEDAFDFAELVDDVEEFKQEVRYWKAYFRDPKYTGTVVTPMVLIDSDVKIWTFDI